MANPIAIGMLLVLGSIQDGPPIETGLAWDGLVSTKTFTELALQATGNEDAGIALETVSGSPVVAAELTLRNGVPATGWMPVETGSLGDVTLRYSIDGGPWTELDAGFLERGAGRVILAGEVAIDQLGQIVGTTIVSATDLPRLPLAYAHVSVLAIGRDALARLDEAQLRALLEYVGLCGSVLLIDPPTQVEQLMSQRAACGGRYLQATGIDGNTADVLETLMTHDAGRLPDERTLGRLLNQRGADIRLMSIYLGGFLLLFITLTAVPRSRAAALAFSLLATALAALLWTGGSRQSFVAWAEVAATERVARYASLERASATGRGAQVLRLQSLARSPMHIMGDGLVLNWKEAARDRYLDWSASLLQEMQVLSMGSFPVAPSLRAGTDGEIVTVCNRGDRETRPAYLHWRGANYRVPALAPGSRWTADASTATTGPSAHLRLLARRASGRAVTLLHPLEVPANGGEQRAWLMQTESGETGATPCPG